ARASPSPGKSIASPRAPRSSRAAGAKLGARWTMRPTASALSTTSSRPVRGTGMRWGAVIGPPLYVARLPGHYDSSHPRRSETQWAGGLDGWPSGKRFRGTVDFHREACVKVDIRHVGGMALLYVPVRDPSRAGEL